LVRLIVLLISACLVTAVASAQRADDILLRAGTFVRETAQRLSGVVADELYEQQLFASFVDSRLSPRIARRAMRSEALFMWLPAASQWVFVRNVLAVDDRPVPDSGDRLDRLFNSGVDAAAYLRQLQEENARFDIGPVTRTFGDPTFALRFLDAPSQARFAFDRAGTERVGGVRAMRFAYHERRRPFVIHVDGMNAQSSGTMWIDPVDGVVLRTTLHVTRPSGRGTLASVTVDFQKDPRLEAWVPNLMSEEYNAGGGQVTRAKTSYANFRRFATSVRVVDPDAVRQAEPR
jgi:hypothetical protein